MGRLAQRVGVLLAGAATGVCVVAVHQSRTGLLLGAAATLASQLALRPGWLRGAHACGWLAVLVVALPARPEGDLAIPAHGPGYLLLALALVVLLWTVATLPVGRRRHPGDATAETGNRSDSS